MALHFQKVEIMGRSTSLKNLVMRFQEYTIGIDYTTADEENCKKSRASITLLECGLKQLQNGRELLQKSFEELKEEHSNCKTKSDKKDLMVEIDQIEEESQPQKTLNDASDLIDKLMMRVVEYKCANQAICITLGYISQKTLANNVAVAAIAADQVVQDEPVDSDNTVSSLQGAESVEQNQTVQRVRRSIKPPQASLPKFHGQPEEFAEYWAVYETLIHKSDELDVIEKNHSPQRKFERKGQKRYSRHTTLATKL